MPGNTLNHYIEVGIMPKPNPTIFDDWSTAELNLRKAQTTYEEATKALVDRITEVNVSWPNGLEDPEFVTVESESGPVMLELRAMDNPREAYMPIYVHHLEKLKL